ncbi:MAG: DNA adenine methylase, partial [Ruminococcaceae bacterium]|nr:DNA adenine methylase [Oscillospiraceae bacterium]
MPIQKSYQPLTSPVTWVGNKKSIRDILYEFFPEGYNRYIEVFGGSGNVLLGKPPDRFEVYNDFNHNLVNLFRCIRERPMALLMELGFLALNARDDFKVLRSFFNHEEFHDEYLEEELELTRIMLSDCEAEEIIELRITKATDYDVRRASMYLRLIRTSYASMGKSFASQPFDLDKLNKLIWDTYHRFQPVIIENQSYSVLIPHYDRRGALFYCDPPYLETEHMYDAIFNWNDHRTLRKLAGDCMGYFLISYNDCP